MDTIAEFLTRIRNAGLAKHEKLDVASSNMRVGLAKILQESGYIRTFKVARDGKQGIMRVYLKYGENGRPVINAIKKLSRPGRRLYVKSTDIPQVRSGYGLCILSTNRGVMSGDQAKQENVGGELLCQLW